MVCFRLTSGQFAAATSSAGVSSLALVVGRTSVKISPVSVVFLLSQFLSVAAGHFSAATCTTSSVSALALVVCFRLTSRQSAAATSSGSVASLALVVGRTSVKISPVSVVFLLSQLLSITAGHFAAATSSAGVASLALMVRRASVKVSPMSVVLFLGQLLSITAEELG
jgi:hypothetical protein